MSKILTIASPVILYQDTSLPLDDQAVILDEFHVDTIDYNIIAVFKSSLKGIEIRVPLATLDTLNVTNYIPLNNLAKQQEIQAAIELLLLPAVVASGVNFFTLQSDVPISASTFTDINNSMDSLAFPVDANESYWFRFLIRFESAGVGAGTAWSLNGPATNFLTYRAEWPSGSTREIRDNLKTYSTGSAVSTSMKSGNIAIIEGVINCSVAGNIIAQVIGSIPSNTITILAKSFVQYKKL